MSAWKGDPNLNEGDKFYTRTDNQAIADQQLLPSLQYLQVDRALLLREECQHIRCMREHAGFSCDGRKLGLKKHMGTQHERISHNTCDVQFRRIQTCMHLVREWENDFSVSFVWFVRLRPDVYHFKPPEQLINI